MSALASNRPPPFFDEAFLDWLRETTEHRWATQPTPTLEQIESEGSGVPDFQQGTRWSGGLADTEIRAIEERLSLSFPPDYRLFLRRLHTTDRPMVGARLTDDGRLDLELSWGITNWSVDEDPIRGARGRLVEGFMFDVEAGGLWKHAWGARPESEDERRRRVADVIAAAPRLIPIHGQCYLVADPCKAGNPVVSIVQSDVVAYGANLREYLISTFDWTPNTDFVRGHEAAQDIPFWGEFVR